MGRKPNQERLDRYEEMIPEYPGAVRPSQLARRLGVAADLQDMEVLDHLIIGQQRFISLRERGLGFS
jgi:hypothetical protein